MEKVGKKVALYARVSEEAKGKLDALAESAGVDKDDVLEHAIELASVAGRWQRPRSMTETTLDKTFDPAAIEAAVHAYVRALNAGDLDAVVALYADDASVEDPVGAAPQVGRDAIRAFYRRSLSVPLVVALEGPVRVAGSECAFAFSVSLTWEGKAMTIRPIDTFRFDGSGRIAQMRAFFGPGSVSAG